MESKKDIIEIKPSIYGIGLNLRELWRRYFSKQKEDPITIVASRFLKVFHDHGVAVTEIPRLIPEVSLEQLRNTESLIKALTPEILDKVSKLFHIRRAWLDGTTSVIYDIHPSYKNPWAFFEDVETLNVDSFAFPLVAFCSVKSLDYKSDSDQYLLLVLREACAQLGEKTIYRYRIHDQFLWGYWKSRIQLKAMMRIWYKKFETPVPIYQIDKNILSKMEEGKIIPHLYYLKSSRIKDGYLEDYSLIPEESVKSKDLDEMPTVFQYIDAFKLEHLQDGAKNPRGSKDTTVFF